MKCYKTEVATLFLGKELENVEPLVYVFRNARTWQRAGNCWIFGTSFSGYLLVFGYFCCFLACDLALLQVLRCSQPYSFEFVRPPRFDLFLILWTPGATLVPMLCLAIRFSSCLLYMVGSNLSRTLALLSLPLVHGRSKPLKDFGFLVTFFGPLRKVQCTHTKQRRTKLFGLLLTCLQNWSTRSSRRSRLCFWTSKVTHFLRCSSSKSSGMPEWRDVLQTFVKKDLSLSSTISPKVRSMSSTPSL